VNDYFLDGRLGNRKNMLHRYKHLLIAFAFIVVQCPLCIAANEAIEGVQAAALDQPRIYVCFRRSANGAILSTKAEPKHKDMLGDDVSGDPQMGAEAFLDTGASGMMLSADTVQKLGIAQEKSVTFEDTGVAGSDKFGVTESLFAALARYPNADSENPADYSSATGPYHMQVRAGGGLLEMIAPGMDVAGMPVMVGQVVAMDPTPLAKYEKIRTAVLPPGDKRIPQTSKHVALTMVSFARFTKLSPAGAAGPDLVANPMIGPDPFAANDSHKPVAITFHGKTVAGTFLLDTGAASSIISTKLAKQLGLKNAADGSLADVPKDQQFELAIGGVGGANQSHGVFFNRLELPTREGPPIVYLKAPLLISDITVADQDGKTFTLDGVFGMNYLVASAEVTGGLMPDVGKIIDGPYRWIVIDFKQQMLGLELK
jgi:hypothetical protein